MKNKKTFIIVFLVILAVVVAFIIYRKKSKLAGLSKEEMEKHMKRFEALLDLTNIDVSTFGTQDWKKYAEYIKMPVSYLMEIYSNFNYNKWNKTEDDKMKLLFSIYCLQNGIIFK